MNFVKRLLRLILLWLGPVAIAAVGGWMYLHGGRIVSTEDAYLKTELVTISSEIGGRVVEVAVEDKQRIKAGQLLFRLDDESHRIALAHSEANLEKVRSNIESLRADYLSKQADINKAENDYTYYVKEQERLEKLGATQSVSQILVDQAAHMASTAQKQVEITRQALAVAKAKVVDYKRPIELHPDYQLAMVERDKAALDLSKVDVKAPMDGVLANFGVKVGEVINPSLPLASLINDNKIWIEANLKETDLTYVRLGQIATVKVDAYPDLQWQAKVIAFTPGTGSEFSLLPAQNSSGNWVKVVQRLNVKLELTPLANSPALAAGMSTFVEIDTGHQRKLPWQQ